MGTWAMTVADIADRVKLSGAVSKFGYKGHPAGFCVACGRKAKQPCEPDAREYPCLFVSCGQRTVYGAEELLLEVQP